MVKKLAVSLVLAGLVAGLVISPVIAEETKADKGKAVAKVNGVALYESNVYFGMPPSHEAAPGMDKYKETMLQEAIKQELLYQEAKKQGLEKDPDYKKSLSQMEKQAQEFEVESLARFFESNNEGLQNARTGQKATDEEISAYYEEHKEQFGNMSKEQASTNISRMIESQKYMEAYNSYIKGIISKAEVKVNGKTLPQDVLIAGMQSYSPAAPPMSQEKTKEVLFPKVAALSAGKEVKSETDTKKAVQDANVTIGKSSFRLGDCYQLTMILNPPENMPAGMPQFNRDLPLFMVLKNHILAEEAKKAGLDKDPRWVSQKEGMGRPPFMPGPTPGAGPMMSAPGQSQERSLLVNLLIQKQGLYDYNKIQVSQEEIDAYYEKNQARYKKLAPEKAKDRITRQLKYEKAAQKMNDYVEKIKKSAKIEILETAKKEE